MTHTNIGLANNGEGENGELQVRTVRRIELLISDIGCWISEI
ncbi:hypothetical protein QM480_13325 [Flectobacillus sp. DC10W]|uniref:Uncharacterized protein n=1 Tax=Flectobacillus longus TaxID=2984207 RepID=A0ABT6YP70_9BACT|nr:hypothetical protein [Flectobacillus longus]MDI9865315.1 hypothetical protein [Flectobacillus longus]